MYVICPPIRVNNRNNYKENCSQEFSEVTGVNGMGILNNSDNIGERIDSCIYISLNHENEKELSTLLASKIYYDIKNVLADNPDQVEKYIPGISKLAGGEHSLYEIALRAPEKVAVKAVKGLGSSISYNVTSAYLASIVIKTNGKVREESFNQIVNYPNFTAQIFALDHIMENEESSITQKAISELSHRWQDYDNVKTQTVVLMYAGQFGDENAALKAVEECAFLPENQHIALGSIARFASLKKVREYALEKMLFLEHTFPTDEEILSFKDPSEEEYMNAEVCEIADDSLLEKKIRLMLSKKSDNLVQQSEVNKMSDKVLSEIEKLMKKL